MRGTYRGEERVAIAKHWRDAHIPHFIDHEIEPLRKFVWNKPALTAIDVGCNKGFWSKALLTVFPEKVQHIYMLDASIENFNEVSNRDDSLLFDEADFPKLSAMHYAVGKETGTIDFYTNEEGSPLGSVFPHLAGGEHTFGEIAELTKVTTVPCETIDNIIARCGIEHVDLMKIDTEGNELNVLLGAESSIAAGKVDTIMFEFGCHQVDARHFFRDFYEFFKKHGYGMHNIDGLHIYEIPKYSYNLERFNECWNFVASRV